MVWHACSIHLSRNNHDGQPKLILREFVILFKYSLLIDNVCKSDTSVNRHKVPFAVMPSQLL